MTKQKSKTRKILSIVTSVITSLVTLFLIFFVVVQAAFPSKSLDIFGVRAFTISYTKSMEPLLKYDDLIFIKSYDYMDIEKGDVIAFDAYLGEELGWQVVTHRVHEIVEYEGRRYLVTMGDNINKPDIRPVTVDGYDNTNVYIGKLAFKSTILGQIMAFLRSKFGMLLLIQLVVSIVLIHVIGVFCRSYIKRILSEEGEITTDSNNNLEENNPPN